LKAEAILIRQDYW